MTDRTLNARIIKEVGDNQAFVAQDLIATTANVIGTSYKGKAFVPQMILPDIALPSDAQGNQRTVYNTQDNIMGSSRQNRYQHLYDSYSCNVESDAYDSVSVWIENGGQQASFTRVLGIGTGTKDGNTNKMIGSGFNAANNIASGTLDHLRGNNINATANGVAGNTSFIFKTINEISKDNTDDDDIDTATVDYLDEIFAGTKDTEANLPNINILSDVIIFPSGVLPSLSIASGSSTSAAEYSNQTKKLNDKTDNNVILNGFSPYHEIETDSSDLGGTNNKPSTYIQDTTQDNSNYIEKQTTYSNADKNFFPNRFLERGHLSYATFPFGGINGSGNSDYKILTAAPYDYVTQELVGDDKKVPDYNSFESEYTTAKTPWITSQPVNREGISDNRINIHEKVQNLFRFWSLDDGEVGNKLRIKVNLTKRGTPGIETNFKKGSDDFATFDIYFFTYDPRINEFNLVETFEEVNLNPNSRNYISRLIGDINEYYDFDAEKVIKKGKFVNKSQYLRVEVHESVENMTFKNQHQLLPSGFRSYPHIKFEKNAFKRWIDSDPDLNTMFDTQGVYQLPPLYATDYYSEYNNNNKLIDNIANHWGVIFNRSEIHTNHSLHRKIDAVAVSEVSPHFYYTKYFLNGIEGSHSYKNIWVEEDNYLNSFFHLEKILKKKIQSASFVNSTITHYKHSGRISSDDSYDYLNLDSDSLWEEDRTFTDKYRDRLSFDFFTYGGFDGVDIRDNDKRFLRNDAIIRELNDLNETSCTYASYDKAIDIAMDESNCAGDILVVPGIREISLVRKCVQKCEEDRRHFYIADISGAASDNLITFEDIINPLAAPKTLISSLGVMGSQFRITNKLDNHTNSENNRTATDERFKLTDTDSPEVGNVPTFYSYKTVLEKNYDIIRPNWLSQDISSRYLFAVYGDLKTGDKQICSENLVLAKMSQSISPAIDIVDAEAINFRGDSLNFNLILEARLNENTDTFDNELKEFRKASVNVIHKNNITAAKLKNQLTSYDVRKSVFQEQKYVRIIQEVKKRIKYNIFRDESLVSGGILFTQNSNLNNLYQKLEIQINSLMSTFVQEGLITNYKVRVNKLQDDSTILDMQNYIIRGNIVLQLTTSDIIELELDEVLSDLSLLADPGQDTTVYIPKI
tara:strand:+ start:15596 stop:19024 length:3429 start_codon:yes stop_codon:yes gene_type:complete